MYRFPTQLAIGPVRVAPATVLAPMAGVTDTVFRRFIRNLGGCGLMMTEFTSSHGVSASMRAQQAHPHLALPGLRSRGAPHLGAVVRRRPGRHGRRRARLPGPGLRHRGYQLRLPGEQGGASATAAPACCAICRWWSRFCATVRAAISIPLDHQVPRRLERPGTGGGPHGAPGRRLRRAGHRAASAHARAGLQRPGRLDAHRRSESRGREFRSSATATSTPGRRRAHGARNRLRCGDDRPRGLVQSVDLPPDRAVSRDRQLTTSPRTRTATR